MTTPLLICDDSNMARKQAARALPEGWDVEVTFAKNGDEAIQLIREGKAEIMLLDLTMPIKDGYQTLEEIRQHDLNVMVIVISGDIQPDARERVMALGAIDFIKKPVSTDKLTDVLKASGLL